MAQEYDKIIKENLTALIFPLSKELLGFEILAEEALPEKLQVTLEREPDFVRIVETYRRERFILHLEFQSANDPEMAFRMAEYKAILQRKFRLSVRQFVIYLGKRKAGMDTQFPEGWEISRFVLKNLCDYDYRRLTRSEVPEAILLAVLGDFHQEAPEEVIQQIISRLREVSKNQQQLQKYIRQLNILSRLRKLEQETLKTIKRMPITFDINQDKIFQMGVRKGISQGIEQGIERNRKKMIHKLLLSAAFAKGHITYAYIAEIAEVSVQKIQKIHQDLKES